MKTYNRYFVCLLACASTLVCSSDIASAQAASEPQSPPGPSVSEQTELIAKGIIFEDRDHDGKFSPGDSAFVGAKVSNGVDIVKTDGNGRYQIPISEESFIFLIKPMGFRTALNKDNLPKFFYIHKPDGSPKLAFPGSKPTGELPRSIDFPLYRQNEPDKFQVLLFGDPQPRNMTEVDYIAQDVVSELIGNTSASFGVSLGDLAFDNLDTLEPLNQTIAMIGIPWYNVIGNHDINLDALNRQQVNETFESIYGPSYYSFDHGQVHFVVMDNIDWGLVDGRQRYIANFGEQQLAWLRKDLSMIPETQMVVLMMHVPINMTKDAPETYRLIENRPLCISISGHTHYHQHVFLGEDDGWQGAQPHHHIINVTVSGSWWSGQKDERGIPHTMMADGAPNGYSILTFDEQGYHLDFKAASQPANEQMRITTANTVDTNATQECDIWVNVYNGSEKSTVRMSIDDSPDWMVLTKTVAPDPTFVEVFEREQKLVPMPEPQLTQPKDSSHLWTAKLPAAIPPGMHRVHVETTDMHGRKYFGSRTLRVTGQPKPAVVSTEESPN